MATQQTFYGYSTRTLSKPDLSITIKVVKRQEVVVTRTRIRGTGKAPRAFWMSAYDFFLYSRARTMLAADWAIARSRLTRTRVVKIAVMSNGHFDNGPIRTRRHRLRPRQRRLRLVPGPSGTAS